MKLLVTGVPEKKYKKVFLKKNIIHSANFLKRKIITESGVFFYFGWRILYYIHNKPILITEK